VARSSEGVTVLCVLAPYPVDLIQQSATLGIEAAIALHRGALTDAVHRVAEHRAVALGEVGSCHFPVSEPLAEAGRVVFQAALESARDADCPVVVHSADLDAAGYAALARTASDAGVPAHHLVKHYARQPIPSARVGVVPSYLAQRDLVHQVRDLPGPWFLETDYLDDPRRPGAVLDLATVPRRAHAIAQDGPEAVERLRTPFVTSVERVYGLELSTPKGGRS
jgi:TatD-related deoxyribonuclease